jgi:hypothetical protein
MKYLVFAFCLGLILTGCMDSNDHGYYGQQPLTCHDFRTCGSCTPVLGCGWCQIGDDGVCVSDPRECAVARSFTFNWEPNECPGVAPGDAAVQTPADAGTDTSEAGAPHADGGFSGAPTGG